MILPKIIDRVQRIVGGGIVTDENRWDQDYIISVINTFSRQVLRDFYVKNNKRINPVCYQRFYCEYDKNIQEPGFIKFTLPPIVSFDEYSDGIRYIGSVTESNGFRRIRSRARLSSFNNHKVMNVNNGRAQSALYNGNDQTIEVYGNVLLRDCLVEGIFINPLDVPTYNMSVDNYPFNEDLIPVMEDLIYRSQLAIEASTPIDMLNNRSDITNQPIQTRR